MTHLDIWAKGEIRTISHTFVGNQLDIAKSIDTALAAGVWQKET